MNKLPGHVAIIMDGNGRWARGRNLPRKAGHKYGAEAFKKIVKHAAKKGIRYLTVYAFSTENWKRPKDEVDAIMDLMREFLNDADKYSKENMRLKIAGDKTALAPDIREKIREIEENSEENTGLTLVIALNYGGRDEIISAVNKAVKDVVNGKISGGITAEIFGDYLYTKDIPDPDLIIRTSGEIRISNFLLWQSAYSEYIFSDTLWPDFSVYDFDKALEEYGLRTRRLGGV